MIRKYVFVHVWLPKVHVEVPTRTSLVLAGAGVYRISKSLSFFGFELLILFSLVSIIFCSFICIFQSDCKSLAAYSSICHIGFVLLSELRMVYYGKSMALVIMLAHGYISVLMFYLLGNFTTFLIGVYFFFSEYLTLNRYSSLYYFGIFLFVYYLSSFYYSVYVSVSFLVDIKVIELGWVLSSPGGYLFFGSRQ
uniref:NADH-ubiquinone oxidoreductase chain 4 n=1 Tax=Elaeophora elaphi TaxID=1147741 RepID=A0A0R3S721_9BILA